MDLLTKMRAIEAARRVLGVGPEATRDEIAAAWKKAAFELHPDRSENGDTAAFLKAKGAWETLRAETAAAEPESPRRASGTEAGRAGTGPVPRRTRVSTREVEVAETARADCRAAVAEGRDDARVDATHVKGCGDASGGPRARALTREEAHIPRRLRRKGRQLSYIVSKPVTFGENRVSLPTGRVDGRGRTKARLIDFGSDTDGPATLEMPEEVREALFPGSSSVRVHFSHEGRKKA